MFREITGKWDDLVNRRDLRGRQVRVVVLDEQGVEATSENGRGAEAGAGDNHWLRSLRAWADSHKPIGHAIDDTRESIYGGTVDEPR